TDFKRKMKDDLKEVGLIKYKDKIVSGFSRGMKQRLGIASALILEPAIIFLDEPTSALDPFGQRDIIKLIEKISEDRVIVLSSHNLKEIEDSVEDLIVLNKGELIFWGSIDDFTSNQEEFYCVEFNSKLTTVEFYELLKRKGVQVVLKDEQSIRFNSNYIEKIIKYLTPYANNLKSIEGNIVSLNDAFEAHILELSKGGESNSDKVRNIVLDEE
ncbi:ATP-binding cassette domain-containing protein, partial [Staphylococcus agnetis]|uniref:ATP-binding cassette domain-containing protein n=1 Tax=Staphylococcus agnetis TaxID=985762 RepID=UPI0014319A8E